MKGGRGEEEEEEWGWTQVLSCNQIQAISKRGENPRRLDIGTTPYKEGTEVVNKERGHSDWRKGSNSPKGSE